MSSTLIVGESSQQYLATRDEITYTTNKQADNETTQEDLVTPDEAARIMSMMAGYEITPDDIRQLRRRNKIKAAKQSSRMTWYERSEIEKAKPPRKHHPKAVEDVSQLEPSGEEKEQREQIAGSHEERVFQIEIQKIELEKQRLALEERRLALEERRLALEEKQLETKRSKMGLAS